MMRSNTTKRLLSVVLALVLVLGLSVTAFAATSATKATPVAGSGYTITITPNTNTTKGDTVSNRYEAYQIFAGTVSNEFEAGTDGTGKIKDPNDNVLSDITWGSGINAKAADFVQALLNDTTALSGTTIGASVKQALETAGYTLTSNGGSPVTWTIKKGEENAAFTEGKVAQAIANWLAKNTGVVKTFADIAGDYVDESGNSYYESTWDTSGTWKVKDVPGGYYLIVDTYNEGGNNEKDTADSEFILTVAGNAQVNVKSDIPTVAKDILGHGANGNAKGDAAGISDTVTFRLTGTLPENVNEYKKYAYTFHDTLSAGLTYDVFGQIYVKVYKTDGTFGPDVQDGSKYDVYVLNVGANGYTLTQSPSDTHSLDVSFADLLTLKGTKATDTDDFGHYTSATSTDPVNVPLSNTSEIIVEYSVTVNENAVFTNTNQVYLEYANDPEWVDPGTGAASAAPTGVTTTQTVNVYTFELDATKKGVGTDENALAGAGFTLTKTVQNEPSNGQSTTYYAVFTKSTTGNDYTLAGWISAAELAEYLDGDDLDGSPIDGADLEEYGFDEEGTYYLAFTSGSDGKMNVKGLDEGVYTISEAVTPDGYNTMDPFDITITANINTTGVLTENTSASVTEGRTDVTADDDGIEEDGKVDLTLQNTQTVLPGTGGMGTTIFRVAGILLLAGAAVYLLLSGRKKRGTEAD